MIFCFTVKYIPCLTLSIIRYVSRVKWSNPGKGVAPFPTPWCSSYGKGSFQVALNQGRQLYLHWYWLIYLLFEVSWSLQIFYVSLFENLRLSLLKWYFGFLHNEIGLSRNILIYGSLTLLGQSIKENDNSECWK